MLEPPVLPYFEAKKHTMCCFKLICITVLAVYPSSLPRHLPLPLTQQLSRHAVTLAAAVQCSTC